MRRRNSKIQSEPSCRMILSSFSSTTDDVLVPLRPCVGDSAGREISFYLKGGEYARNYCEDYEVSRRTFNQCVSYYAHVFVIYQTKVVAYEIRKRRTHYNKRIIKTIPMDQFSEPYVYIGEVLKPGNRLDYSISPLYVGAYGHIISTEGSRKAIYQVPLDHLGGPDYYFLNWSRYPEVEGWDPDKKYFYDVFEQLPDDLEAQRLYMIRLMAFIRYTFDPKTNLFLRKEAVNLDEPWDWNHFIPEYFYRWDRHLLPD